MNFFTEYNSVQKILKIHHQVVVYAESRHYYQYFESLLEDIIKDSSLKILYITSDKKDPLLSDPIRTMEVVYINQFLGLLFSKIKSDLVVMTMPDLNNFLYKKSAFVKKYIYVFHAAVSTHLQYREKAFFYYDTIFCTGPYQASEIREAEKIYGLEKKELVSYGYPLIDSIRQKFLAGNQKEAGLKQRILIAPSWFEFCILETCIEELLQELSKLNFDIYLRSHPEYIKRSPKKYKDLKNLVSGLANVYFDESADVINNLIHADILITDRSGIALEYAFGTQRPVLFVDTPLKISNPNWKKLALNPVEISIRPDIGLSILPNELSTVREKIQQLLEDKDEFKKRIRELEHELFFNSPQSYKQGLNYILENTIRN